MENLKKLRLSSGKNAAAKLANEIRANPELKKNIREWTAKLYDKNSPTVKARRRRAKNEFLQLMRAIHDVANDVSDESVSKCSFAPENVVANAVMYINAVAQSTSIKGVISEKIKTGSLRQRVEALWWWAGWEAGPRIGELWFEWQRDISAAIHKASVDFCLGTGKYEKQYFSAPELKLLFSVMSTKTRYVDWQKQHYVAYVLSYITGCRPGTIALSKGYEKTKQALYWKNITFRRDLDKPGIIVEIHYEWLKGQRDPYNIHEGTFRGAKFLVKPCREPENLFSDLTLLLLLLGMDRGLFGSAQLTDLLEHESSVLPQDPTVSEQPVFCALTGPNNTQLVRDKPMAATAFNPVLQRNAFDAGLVCRVTMYVFRREFITAMGRNLSLEEAKKLATHRSAEQKSVDPYDFGLGDLDVAAFVTGEHASISDLAHERNQTRRMVSAPAAHFRGELPLLERRNFVKAKLAENELVVAFEDALVHILSKIRIAFGLEELVLQVQSIFAALEKLAHETSAKSSSSSAMNYSSRVWIPPKGFDASEPESWSAVAVQACGKEAMDAVDFLKAFLRRRKSARNFIIFHVQRAFEKDWKASLPVPTTAEVKERLHQAQKVPTILTVPSDSVSRALQEDLSVTASHETGVHLSPSSSSAEEDRPDLDADETQVRDIMATEIPLWDGCDSNDPEAHLDDTATMELDSDVLDPLTIPLLESNGTIEVVLPGEEDEVAEEHEQELDAIELPGTEADRLKYYNSIRDRIVTKWQDWTETPRGHQTCRTCLLRAEGPCGHTTEFPSAEKYLRHLRSAAHKPDAQFELWAVCCIANPTRKPRRYKCPMDGCETRPQFSNMNDFHEHCKHLHAAFLTRLQQ